MERKSLVKSFFTSAALSAAILFVAPDAAFAHGIQSVIYFFLDLATFFSFSCLFFVFALLAAIFMRERKIKSKRQAAGYLACAAAAQALFQTLIESALAMPSPDSSARFFTSMRIFLPVDYAVIFFLLFVPAFLILIGMAVVIKAPTEPEKFFYLPAFKFPFSCLILFFIYQVVVYANVKALAGMEAMKLMIRIHGIS